MMEAFVRYNPDADWWEVWEGGGYGEWFISSHKTEAEAIAEATRINGVQG